MSQILTLTDTNAEWSKTLGLQLDLTGKGLGIRTDRFAIIVDDLCIKYIGVSSTLVSGANSWLIFFSHLRLRPNREFPSPELIKF